MARRQTVLTTTFEDQYEYQAPIKILYGWTSAENGAFFWKVRSVEVAMVRYTYSDDDVPAWARAVADKHRPTASLAVPDAFTEVAPFGPTDHGDTIGDLQVGEAYGRRFARKTSDGWLVIDTAFCTAAKDYDELYAVVEGGAKPSQIIRTDTHIRCSSLDPGGDPPYEDTAYHTVAAVEPTPDTAKMLCAKLRPEDYVWDGQDIVHGPPE